MYLFLLQNFNNENNILIPFRNYIVSIGYVHTNNNVSFIERLVTFSTNLRGRRVQFTAVKIQEPNPERV